MVVLSLLLNIAVLVPVCAGLLGKAGWAQAAYGDDTPARRILLSVYAAILLVSATLLFHREPRAVAALLAVQVVYKLTTPFAVGTLANPVVVSNLGIAVFHAATLAALWSGGALGGSVVSPPAGGMVTALGKHATSLTDAGMSCRLKATGRLPRQVSVVFGSVAQHKARPPVIETVR